MVAKFVAEDGNMKGQTLSLEDGSEWVIGRDPETCQILVEDPAASRKHLVCHSSPEGIVVENLSETNPVEVNQEKVEGKRLLKNGDSVKIGSGIFRFYTERDKIVPDQIEQNGQESEEPQKEPNGQELFEEQEEPKEELSEEEPPEGQEGPQEEEAFKEQDSSLEEDAAKEAEHHPTIYEEGSDEDKGVLAEIDFDLRETGRWLLKVIGGPNNGAEFSMQPGNSYIIGTDPTACDVVFHDTSVSRQQARITVGESEALTIEDLNSRNGTLVEGETVEGKRALEPNTMVTMGTTSFIIFDREGDMQTIISPLLPSIVKVLQREGKENSEEKEGEEKGEEEDDALKEPEELPAKKPFALWALIGTVALIAIVVGTGTMTLFQSKPVQIQKQINYDLEIKNALKAFPSVQYSYTPSTGILLLVGHVLTPSDKNQLLYNLQSLPFIRNFDDKGLIVDQYVWQETNAIIHNDPRWQGISIHSPKAGEFVLSGYLKTRKQAEALSNYITSNFPYLDLLKQNVIVEENVKNTVITDLHNAGIRNLKVEINNGILSLNGGLSKEQIVTLNRLIRRFKEIPGIQSVKTFITEMQAEQVMTNITSQYPVTGFSHQGGANTYVVIHGKILSRGDAIDGMTITSIRPHVVFLEKGGVKYRIDYNQ